jgi:carbon-monoxide dehydrogenase medium subunit
MKGRKAAYLKCTTRSADDWPALGIAVVLEGERQTGFVSAATDKPTRLAAAEEILAGKMLTDALVAQAAKAAQEIQIDGDLHGSAAYKKHLIGVYLRRAVHEARDARH